MRDDVLVFIPPAVVLPCGVYNFFNTFLSVNSRIASTNPAAPIAIDPA